MTHVGLACRTVVFLGLLVAIAFNAVAVFAAPIPVRFAEGFAHGYLALRDENGDRLADGELIQKSYGHVVDSRLVFRFKDGSLYDERVSFTQKQVFTLQSYKLVQRGPSFPNTLDISLDRKSSEYRVLTSQDGTPEQKLTGRLDLPDDVVNGMIVTVLRNLMPGRGETVHFLAFTPEPKVLDLKLVPTERTTIRIGDLSKPMTRYVIEPKLDSLTMWFGKLLGKLPEKFHYHFWLVTDEVPTFGGFEGPLHLLGPTWRIEQTVSLNLWSKPTDSTKPTPR